MLLDWSLPLDHLRILVLSAIEPLPDGIHLLLAWFQWNLSCWMSNNWISSNNHLAWLTQWCITWYQVILWICLVILRVNEWWAWLILLLMQSINSLTVESRSCWSWIPRYVWASGPSVQSSAAAIAISWLEDQ